MPRSDKLTGSKADITIKEIARRAGVSIATVSRVINKVDHPVRDETRKRVEAAVAKLHYSTNIYGKGLAGKSNIIGLCVGAPLSVDPGFAVSVARIIEGIKGYARQCGFHVLLEVDDRLPDELDHWEPQRFFAGVKLAGLMMVAPRRGNPMVPQLMDRGIPLIVIGSRDFPKCHFVDADNDYAGRRAVQHFAELERKRIGCLGGPTDFSPSVDMVRGFKAEIHQLRLSHRREWFARPHLSVEGGRAAALRMLSLREPPDAIFAFTDFLALGVLQAAQEVGVRVPEDLSVIGYDDFAVPFGLHPQLTTFRHPDHEMADQAIRWMIEQIIPSHEAALLQATFRPELIVRESCGLGRVAVRQVER